MKPFKMIICLTVMLMVFLPLTLQGSNLDLPETVKLDKLAKLYEGVEFDHEMHTEIADDCTVCHHHTVGMPSSNENCSKCHNTETVPGKVACADCHALDPFSAEYLAANAPGNGHYHIDKPGLKAAYHLNCLNCHEEMGGPEGCEDCHERTKLGDAFYRSGSYAPKGSGVGSAH